MSKETIEEEIPSFEEGLAQLEAIVEEMEDGSMPLEKLIVRFESGSRLLAQCEKQLKEAELKIEVLRSKKGEPAQYDDLGAGQ